MKLLTLQITGSGECPYIRFPYDDKQIAGCFHPLTRYNLIGNVANTLLTIPTWCQLPEVTNVKTG